MCKEFCGSDYPYVNHFPVNELVYFHDRFDGDRYNLNPWKIVGIELKGGCVYYRLESGTTSTTVTGKSIRSYSEPTSKKSPPDVMIGGEVYKHQSAKPSTYQVICSTHHRADGKKLIEFQEEYCRLVEWGVPPHEIVKSWNDSQDSFWNKVYLVEDKS